jgi:exonuclease SbcC
VNTARDTLLPKSDEQAALAAREGLNNARSYVEGRLAALVDKGLPDVEPDLSALIAADERARKIATEMTDRSGRARSAMDDLKEALEGIDHVDAGTVDLRRRADLTQRAQLVCRGQVAPKVSLRRWVLGRELERVVDAASQHRSKMTGGRYTLRRVADSVGGNSAKLLDLEVHDAHTGRPRKPNSLSGGEQFQASLTLALGLADVVSRGGAGNGRKIEALFVDEGFGSLDPRALDDAIETLHSLQETGRMVGAITHVEAMKERLHAGIVVTRLPDGRGSTLTVLP